MKIDPHPEFHAALLQALREQFPRTVFEIKFSDYVQNHIIIWWPPGLRHCRVPNTLNTNIQSFISAFTKLFSENTNV